MEYRGIRIKMDPTDTMTLADLLITRVITGEAVNFDSTLENPISGDMTELDKNFELGDKVTFLMRLYSVGNEEVPHLAEVKSIKKASGNNKLSKEALTKIQEYKFKDKRIFNKSRTKHHKRNKNKLRGDN